MDKFSYFRSYYEALKGLKAKARYAIREAIDVYMFEGKEPVFTDSLSKSMWSLLLPNLNKSKTYFDNRNGKTKENQIDNKTTSKAQQINIKSKTNQEQTHPIGKGIGKGIGEEKKEEKKTPGGVRSASASPAVRFIKPTLDQVKDHIREKGYHFDAESFYAFYESKGWKVGNQPMKSWEMACITWEKRMPHTEQEPEVKKKPVPEVSQCPDCGSYDLIHTIDRVICKGCGAFFDYNHTKGKWERA